MHPAAESSSYGEWLRRSLPGFLARQRWFGGKARTVDSVDLLDIVPMQDEGVSADLVLAQVYYQDHAPDEVYSIPLLREARTRWDSADRSFRLPSTEPLLTDALLEPHFLRLLLKSIERGLVFPGSHGEVRCAATSAFGQLAGPSGAELPPTLLKAEQSNSSVAFDERLILKVLRQAREGINPELEIGRFLTERARGARVPLLAGSIVYYSREALPRTLGILQAFVPNQGNAWEYTLREVAEYSVRVAAVEGGASEAAPPELASEDDVLKREALIGSYLSASALLGKRTAELHRALASDSTDSGFAPEPLSSSYQKSLLESIMDQAGKVFDLMRGQLSNLPEPDRSKAEALLELRRALEEQLQSFAQASAEGARIRVHGDYHLGQVLCSDGDFTIIDFEGEPARTLDERRTKHSPLLDVAGMLRSFHYAALQGTRPWLGKEHAAAREHWVRFWRHKVSSRFLRAYLETSEASSYLPRSGLAITSLLNIYLVNKAIYELQYELNNRPDWVAIPLGALLEILGARAGPQSPR